MLQSQQRQTELEIFFGLSRSEDRVCFAGKPKGFHGMSAPTMQRQKSQTVFFGMLFEMRDHEFSYQRVSARVRMAVGLKK